MRFIEKWKNNRENKQKEEFFSEEHLAKTVQLGKSMQRFADEHIMSSEESMHSDEALAFFKQTASSYGILLVLFSELA